ncbi:MAG TPA: M50 family metallopeptidase [bacterium]|nr:M50 family metallopeptidase [bacterium]
MKVARLLIKSVFFAAFATGAAGYATALWKLLDAPWAVWTSDVRLWLAVGFVLYFPIHIIFRRLIVLHVFGHELTHALWSMLFGGKVEELYVSRRNGGFAAYTKGNFIVTLAPYFFPLYAVFFLILHLIVAPAFRPYIDGLLGASIAFHIMLTVYTIRLGQPDLARAGALFSMSFILMMNFLGLGLIFSAAVGEDVPGFLRDGLSYYPVVWDAFKRGAVALWSRTFGFLDM